MGALTGRPPGARRLLDALGAKPPPVGAWEDRDWAALAAAAEPHGVTPLVWCRLQAHGLAALAPPHVQRHFEELGLLHALRAAARQEQLAAVVGALGAHEIPVVLLKGADVATRLYPAPALRPMTDLDLLVPTPQLRASVAALAEVGYPLPDESAWAAYASGRHAPPLRRPGRLPVELHDAITPWAPPFRLPTTEPWARAQPASIDGALVLDSDDLLLHVTTHMGRNHLLGSSLLRVCDVDAWVARHGGTTDWDAIVRRARESGARRFVSTALALAARLLGTDVPGEVRRALHEPSDDVVVADAEALLDSTCTELSGALALTRGGEDAWQRLTRVMRALALPPKRAAAAPGADAEAALRERRATFQARWWTVARVLLHPSSIGAIPRRLARVRRLREWANETG